MKVIKYLLVGFVLNCTTKSEAVSWYRIYEMFQFDVSYVWYYNGCHLNGIIGIQIMKRRSIKDIKGIAIEIKDKDQGSARYSQEYFDWLGSCVFPGPIFILLGAGSVLIVLLER
jgi:hypothetical protein